MHAEIITIGDEILIGQIVDTNSAWLGSKLNEYGIEVVKITTINDKKESIINALQNAEKDADIIILTGGLGPTKDDITKKVLTEYFDTELVLNMDALANVNRIIGRLGAKILQVNQDQALVPKNCSVIQNKKGTAPGMYFERNNKIYVSMPGVPFEMKAMMTDVVFDRLSLLTNSQTIVHRTITVVGVPESHLANSIQTVEDSLPTNIKLAYLPDLNLVKLRLSAKSNNRNEQQLVDDIESYFSEIKSFLGNVWFDGDHSIAEEIGKLLLDSKQNICTIESCSGGYIAHQITSIAGSSAYYEGSSLTYSYESKVTLADVDQNLLNTVGAVSPEVCKMMALNTQKKLGTNYCIATTGIAGPGGGTSEKPVGLVYIGLAKPDGTVDIKRCEFRGNRVQVIKRTANEALNMLRKTLSDKNQSVLNSLVS